VMQQRVWLTSDGAPLLERCVGSESAPTAAVRPWCTATQETTASIHHADAAACLPPAGHSQRLLMSVISFSKSGQQIRRPIRHCRRLASHLHA
jgi:hypothetical protein